MNTGREASRVSHRYLSRPRSVRATVYGFIITELITNKTLSFAFQGLGLKLQEIPVSLISLCRIYYRFAIFCTILKKERIRISQERNMTSTFLVIFCFQMSHATIVQPSFSRFVNAKQFTSDRKYQYADFLPSVWLYQSFAISFCGISRCTRRIWRACRGFRCPFLFPSSSC